MEQFLPVRGFEGLYEVSSDGYVLSLGRIGYTESGRKFKKTKKALKNRPSGDSGHMTVALYDEEGNPTYFSTHLLVFGTFHDWLPAEKSDLYVGFRDGDISNCSLSNLVLRSFSQLMIQTTPKGVDQPKSKLKPDQIKLIRGLKGKVANTDIAKLLGVTQATICCIQKNKTWKHVQ